jgi:hypothetical protein
MGMLSPAEKSFLDVFLHEATTEPFNGPATKVLHNIGVEYQDISFLAWAYDQEVLRTSFEWGHAAEISPPLPWSSRETAVKRNTEVQHLWVQKNQMSIVDSEALSKSKL